MEDADREKKSALIWYQLKNGPDHSEIKIKGKGRLMEVRDREKQGNGEEKISGFTEKKGK